MAGVARKLIPLFDRVLVQKVKPMSKTVGGIVLPDSAMPKLNEFTIVAVGNGMRTRDGTTVPPQVQVGQRVLIADQFGGQEVKLGDEDFHLFREEDILGILQQPK